jgi:hypothetical protein
VAILSEEQYPVVKILAGWNALAKNSRRLTGLQGGLDELYPAVVLKYYGSLLACIMAIGVASRPWSKVMG